MAEIMCYATKGKLTVYMDGKAHVYTPKDKIFSELLDLLADKNFREISRKIKTYELEKSAFLESLDGDGFSVRNGCVYVDSEEVTGSLATQIREYYSRGEDTKSLVNFVKLLRKNPSYRIREQLWNFMGKCQEDGGFTLLPNGYIVGYKKIRSDWKDIHSGTYDNHIGKTVSMDRKDVSDDPNDTCSSGLHFCSKSYLDFYGSSGENDRIVQVCVSPEDVVSIPNDHNFSKARCCKYSVLKEVFLEKKENLQEKLVLKPEDLGVPESVYMETLAKLWSGHFDEQIK